MPGVEKSRNSKKQRKRSEEYSRITTKGRKIERNTVHVHKYNDKTRMECNKHKT